MRAIRQVTVLLGCCFVGLLVLAGPASAASVSSSEMAGSPVGGRFLSPDMLMSLGEQVESERQVRLASPEAVVGREESELKYANLRSNEVGQDLKSIFPVLVDEHAGGPPRLPTGDSIVGFPAVNIAHVKESTGAHSVIESAQPMALHTTQGLVPIDLGLVEEGGAFEPKTPLVDVQIPKHVAQGVSLAETGVSLTAVGEGGAGLGGEEASTDGATVVYANTQTDSDTLVKPTTTGFELDSILRSIDSPTRLFYKVGIPEGASLKQEGEAGAIAVTVEGTPIARITAPVAHDAEGTTVPVSVSIVSGNIISVSLPPVSEGNYKLPIVVDPTAEREDPVWSNGYYGYKTEWHFEHYGAGFGGQEQPENGSWTETIYYGHWTGEWGGLFYTTQGASQITKAAVEGHWNDSGSHIANFVVMYAPHETNNTHTVDYDSLPETTESWGGYACDPVLSCPETHVPEPHAPEENENTVAYEQEAVGNGEGHGGENVLTSGYVYIKQEQGPELEFTKQYEYLYNEQTKEYVPNVLYEGHEKWLGPHQGAFAVRAKDPGIGLSLYRVATYGWGDYKYYYDEEDCKGIQCPQTNYANPEHPYVGYTYQAGMLDGEDSFEALAQDYDELYKSIYPQKIKVDYTPPHVIELSGLQNGNELPVGEHSLAIRASDGEGGTPSSGVRSIKVSIEGHEVSTSEAKCEHGPCTAETKFTVASRDYSTGTHSLVVTATDNAGNVAQEEFTFRVHGASPVSVGPGEVDPSSGQYTLSATDVSLGGLSSVARTYESRDLTAGAEGPLGPQWAMSIAGSEALTVASTGNVQVTSASGSPTTFVANGKGGFESPKGDSNLKLEYKPEEHGEERQYVMKDTNAGSETVYEQPVSLQGTSPVYEQSFGSEPGGLSRPVSDALEANGDLWVTDWQGNRIAKFSPAGALLGEYGSEGSGAGQFANAWGIAVNEKTGNVYVTDAHNDRVEEFSSSGTFIKTFGWGVSNGKDEYETCTKECKAGIAGSGNGQFNVVTGIAIDSSGDIWAVDEGNDRVEEFSEEGGYLQQFGTAGTGAGQFEVPLNVALAGGDVYVTDLNNDRIDEFSTAGAFIKTFGWGVANGEEKVQTCTSSCKAGLVGSGNGEYNQPRDVAVEPASGDLYVAEAGNNRVQEVTTSGSFVTKFGSGGSGAGQFAEPMGVAVSAQGALYVTDFEHSQVQEWARPTWWPVSARGALSTTATYVYGAVEGSSGASSMQPAEILSPVPQGISCGTKPEELKDGCRALTFKYATSTTASGENESEWGEYKGHLSQIAFHGYNSSSKTMEEKPVADYAYDKQGRLRAEWDPRLEHPLKAIYGYDAEGHVTSLTPPGQESWAFIYGTIPGDSNTGRLLKVTRAPAARALWDGDAAANSEAPKLSGSAVVGVRMSASDGSWSNSPAVYGYQWEDCNSSGKECTPILGASNENYTPTSTDVGHTLVAVVTAINGAGSTSASSAASVVVATKGGSTEGEYHAPQPGSTIEYDVPVSGSGAPYALSKEEVEKWAQKDYPVEAGAIFAPDEPQGWPASSYTRATVHYWDQHGRTVNTAIPTGGIATSEYNEANETIRALGADNRAAALAEGCVSLAKKECKSAETAEKLDTKTEYNAEETNIVKVTGPEHMVKLATGEEVQARAVTHDYYDEGAKEAEEKTHETYDLLTKTTSGALLSSGEEKEIRTTTTSYNGQEDIGWKLRKPTSVTDEPAGLNLTTTTIYSETTGNVVETRSAKGSVSGSPTPPVFAAAFGSSGSGEGQFTFGGNVALDSSGNVWVADYGNNRIEKFSPEGKFLASIGTKGSGEGQMDEPYAIAINKTSGDIYVAEIGNQRVQELSSEGSFIRAFGSKGSGNGEFDEPDGLAIDQTGHVWVADSGNNRIEEFSSEGAFIKTVGSKGSGTGELKEPNGITFSGKDFYVSDWGNSRIEEFSEAGGFIRQFGSSGTGNGQFKSVHGVAADPVSGNIYVADSENHRVQEFTANGTFITKFGSEGSGNGKFKYPWGIAITSEGTLYIGDIDNERIDEWQPAPAGTPAYTSKFGVKGSENGQLKEAKGIATSKNGNLIVLDSNNNRLQEFSPSGKYEAKFGASGTGAGEMKSPYGMALDSKGNIWVADTANARIDEFNEKHEFVQAIGWGVNNGEAKLETCTSSCQAGIAGAGAGQFDEPKDLTVTTGGTVYVSDTLNDRIDEFSEKGEFVAAFGFGVSNEKNEFQTCTSSCKAGLVGSGNGQFNGPTGISATANGNIWVADRSNNRVQEFNEKDEYLSKFGTYGTANGHLKEPKGLAVSATGDLWVSDTGNNRIQEFTPAGEFLAAFGDKGTGNAQFEEPWGITFLANGITYIADNKNNRIDEWTPAPRPGNEAAHDTKTIYYSAKEEAEISACRNHPEWANLPCQIEPVAQPAISQTPSLPVTTFKYNLWDEIEKTTEEFTRLNSEHKEETVKRVKAQTYDSAGRALTSEETSSPANDTTLPKVTNEYNTETGALEKQSATIKGETKTLTSKDNTLGQLIEYKDAEGNIAKYAYEEGSDGRLEEISEGKGEEAKSSQAYSYNATTGFMEKLVDSAAGTFTASYDLEGKMTSDVYPNGMCANTSYNQAGQAISLQYIKTHNCTEKEAPVWFTDSIAPSIHGETLEQTSTLAKEKYTYDNAGRLTETQETPAGKDCVSRLYANDEESNRTSLTTRESTTETCLTEGGIVQTHFYDSANRLIDPGIEYEAFGNITKVPAIDAGEHEIKSTYYLDNQVATQTQNEQLNTYTYDPAGRTLETTTENEKTKTKTTTTEHYAGSGSVLSWASEGAGKWSRNIQGIEGALAAIQTAGSTPLLQLHDLQGNIVATAEDNETASKLLTTYNSTEFGVPQPGTSPPKYSWLGAAGITSEPGQAAGTSTQSGASYVPEIGRPLQTGTITSPGAFPDGMSEVGIIRAPYVGAASAEFKEIAAREYLAQEEAKRRQAEEQAKLNERPLSETHVDGPGEGNCESNCWVNEEEYYYEQARVMAEEEEASEASTEATSASFKLRLSEGCLDAGFWTYCTGQYKGKWYDNKVESSTPYKKEGVPTGVRVAGAIDGAVVAIAGGGAAAGCFVGAAATPEDGQLELVPTEVHCMMIGAGALLAGGALFVDSLGL